MDKHTKKRINYRAKGARNGIEILIVGAIGLVFIMAFNLLRSGTISIVEIFLVQCLPWSYFLLGFLKNPRTLLQLNFERVCY
ncbi:hypothetical protein P20480_1698 [Pseudoalteromonas sp. BSi20480]|nr:hypothetical protein P20480_1698 [Pseudoalteromonas sp. BSi20480]